MWACKGEPFPVQGARSTVGGSLSAGSGLCYLALCVVIGWVTCSLLSGQADLLCSSFNDVTSLNISLLLWSPKHMQ